jgi:mitochondrial fission protein ELM1
VKPACWVITDGAAGNEKQALALAQALGHTPRVLRLQPRWPWRWLAPDGPRDPRTALRTADCGQLDPPWPSLAIGCGRAAALFTRGLRRVSRGDTRVVQILDPRRHRCDFDVIVAPRHDHVLGANVVETLGALNDIDDAWLADGRAAFAHLAELPSPRIAVLVGGAARGAPFTAGDLEHLLQSLATLQAREGGSLLVTASRRTPATWIARLRAFVGHRAGMLWAPGDALPNPYAGLLGWADRIVVTPDSTNLLTEACAVGVPVSAPLPQALSGKRRALVATLLDRGHLRRLGDDDALAPVPPLRELAAVVTEIRSRLDGRATPTPSRNAADRARYP